MADASEAAEAAGSVAQPLPPASGAQDAGERMYALPHDSPAAAADAGELRHLVRWPSACDRSS